MRQHRSHAAALSLVACAIAVALGRSSQSSTARVQGALRPLAGTGGARAPPLLRGSERDVLARLPALRGSFADLPRRMSLRGGGGKDAGGGGYTTKWSTEHKSGFLTLQKDDLVAYCPADKPIEDCPTLEDKEEWLFTPDGWSVRAQDPIPSSGQHYFEVRFREWNLTDGEAMEEGWNTFGLVTRNVTRWEDFWWEDERRNHSWGLHDSQLSSFVCKSDPFNVSERWAEWGGFGSGDRVGLLVDMDARTATYYKNEKYFGVPFTNLPEELYPMVTLVAERPNLFGQPGSPGMVWGSCKVKGHAEKGCSGLCDLRSILGEEKYWDLWGGPASKRWHNKAVREGYRSLGITSWIKGTEAIKQTRRHKLNNSDPEASVQVGRPGSGVPFNRSALEAPNFATLRVSKGTHKWQQQPSALEVEELCENNETYWPYTDDHVASFWHWDDVLIIPKDCGVNVVGADRGACVLFGRWQLRNESRGSVREATLLSEPPSKDDYTLEVWGAWAFEECNLRCAGGIVVRVDHEGEASVRACSVGGDGLTSRRARIGVDVESYGRAIVEGSSLLYIGTHTSTAALRASGHGRIEMRGSRVREADICLQLSAQAQVVLEGNSIEEMDEVVFWHAKQRFEYREDPDIAPLCDSDDNSDPYIPSTTEESSDGLVEIIDEPGQGGGAGGGSGGRVGGGMGKGGTGEGGAEDGKEESVDEAKEAKAELRQELREELAFKLKEQRPANTRLELRHNRVFLSAVGNYSLWGSELRPKVLEDVNNSYIAHPDTIDEPPFPPSVQHVFNGSAEGEVFMNWMRDEVPDYYQFFSGLRDASAASAQAHAVGDLAQAMGQASISAKPKGKSKKQLRKKQDELHVQPVGPTGRLMCVQGHTCLFQHMDKEHAARYDHNPPGVTKQDLERQARMQEEKNTQKMMERAALEEEQEQTFSASNRLQEMRDLADARMRPYAMRDESSEHDKAPMLIEGRVPQKLIKGGGDGGGGDVAMEDADLSSSSWSKEDEDERRVVEQEIEKGEAGYVAREFERGSAADDQDDDDEEEVDMLASRSDDSDISW